MIYRTFLKEELFSGKDHLVVVKDIKMALFVLFSSFAHFKRSVRIYDDAERFMSKKDAIVLDNEILEEL